MLKPGDSVSISVSPTIQLREYQFLKPSATVRRVLSDDVDGDLAEMAVEVRRLAVRAATIELGLINELLDVVEEGDMDTLAAYLAENADGKAQVVPEEDRSARRGTKKTTKRVRRAR